MPEQVLEQVEATLEKSVSEVFYDLLKDQFDTMQSEDFIKNIAKDVTSVTRAEAKKIILTMYGVDTSFNRYTVSDERDSIASSVVAKLLTPNMDAFIDKHKDIITKLSKQQEQSLIEALNDHYIHLLKSILRQIITDLVKSQIGQFKESFKEDLTSFAKFRFNLEKSLK